MPFAGLGLHIVLAILCAIHVVRTGQQLYWLFILFAFPLLGSLVYFFGVYLPNSRLERGTIKAIASAARAMDPGRELREARSAFDLSPSAQNQMRLAAALLDAGQAQEASEEYERALRGPFATDLDIRLGAARALVTCERFVGALQHLEFIRSSHADFRPDQVSLLIARSFAGAGRSSEARAEFESAVQRFGTFEAYAEYAIWTLTTGDLAKAAQLQQEIDRMVPRWNAMARELNDATLRRLNAAKAIAKT